MVSHSKDNIEKHKTSENIKTKKITAGGFVSMTNLNCLRGPHVKRNNPKLCIQEASHCIFEGMFWSNIFGWTQIQRTESREWSLIFHW